MEAFFTLFKIRQCKPGVLVLQAAVALLLIAAVAPYAYAACSTSSPSGTISDTTPAFTWTDGSCYGTYFYLEVWNQSTASYALQQWYSSSSVDCSGGICSIDPGVTLNAGNHYYWRMRTNYAWYTGWTYFWIEAGTTYYRDSDGDGYGDPGDTTTASSPPSGYVENDEDCDDTDANINPGATEVCDGVDNDCDSYTDEGLTITFYEDADNDGYGNPASTTEACSAPTGYVSDNTDCDDSDPNTYPGATELCDGVDNNCDTYADEGALITYYQDSDNDGYGNPLVTTEACTAPTGYVSDNTDCDDDDYQELPGQTWYEDMDVDGYGVGNTTTSCERPSGYQHIDDMLATTGDCDDLVNTIHPGAAESCEDGIDQDCDGSDAECTTDNDGDGWTIEDGDCDDTDATIYPNAPETCGDGVDQNCYDGDRACDEVVCANISDVPLDTLFQAAAANIMFVLDNSGSMDFSFLTSESGGNFNGRYYVYPLSSNKYDNDLPSDDRDLWKSQWYGYNKIFYNPNIDYDPWPATDTYSNLTAFSGSSTSLVKDHPVIGSVTMNLDSEFSSSSVSGQSIPNAHYYAKSGDHTYLVTMTGGSIRYYRLDDDTKESVKDSGLTSVDGSSLGITSRSYDDERQNFANWFTFYRRRSLAANAALATVIQNMSGVNIGIYTINQNPTSNPDDYIAQPVLAVHVDGVDNTDTLIDLLYELEIQYNVGTPLRNGLEDVGQYFDDTDGVEPSGLGASPFDTEANGGACQQTFAIVMTDGYWSGSDPGITTDQDGDSHTKTLADVAMYYYKRDLSTLADKVPTNAADDYETQHMVTYGVAFGVDGTLDPDNFPNCPTACDTVNPECDSCPDWPDPESSSQNKIDDLYHATVNGRGDVWSAEDPAELATALTALMQDIERRLGSGASLSINSQELSTGTVLYQGSYSTDSWTGDVRAYALDSSTGEVADSYTWSASDELEADLATSNWWSSSRIVITNNGGIGIPFNSTRYNDIGITEDLINYIRGDDSLEGSGTNDYRVRSTKLGDIVHSAPYLHNDVIYAGANDGMLHAFDADTGEEIFAYVPSFVVQDLNELTNQSYSHKYYVDLTPYALDISDTETLLVGGLGKGGKGYFCLDISSANLSPVSEDTAAPSIFKWAYPTTTDDDLGYTFSRAFIVNSTQGWVVVFGNGYDSTNSKAVLYILDADDGTLIKKIDTEFGDSTDDCNGLSTPVMIDPDSDGLVDYVYAGDLRGNLWKFDLTSSNTDDWDVAFEDSSGTPQPLIQVRNENGFHQPITTQPDVIRHCHPGRSGYIVVFGTGRYLGSDDFSDTSVQSIYAVWDWVEEWEDDGELSEQDGTDKYYGIFNVPDAENEDFRSLSNLEGNTDLPTAAQSVTLLEQTVVASGTGYRVYSDNEISWYNPAEDDGLEDQVPGEHAGWYFDLPDTGERIIREYAVRDQNLIIISSVPSQTPCEAGGYSWISEMNACTGGRLNSPQFDYNEDGVVDSNDTVSIDDPNSDDPNDTIDVPPTSLSQDSMVYFPIILTIDPDVLERKYFSTSVGTVITMDEAGESVGIFYWKEYD